MPKKQKAKKPAPVHLDLCVGSYHAQQTGPVVNLTATGGHPTAGYDVFFQQSPIDIFPPEFTLYHRAPAGPVLDVVTPFSTSAHFVAAAPVPRIVVHDAVGAHPVDVEPASSEIHKHILQLHSDGPLRIGKAKPSAALAAISTIGGGSSVVWPNLVRLLTAWCKIPDPVLADILSALWLRTSGGQNYPDVGIPALLRALRSDRYFGPCTYQKSITAGRLLGDLKTVKNLYDALYACGLA